MMGMMTRKEMMRMIKWDNATFVMRHQQSTDDNQGQFKNGKNAQNDYEDNYALHGKADKNDNMDENYCNDRDDSVDDDGCDDFDDCDEDEDDNVTDLWHSSSTLERSPAQHNRRPKKRPVLCLQRVSKSPDEFV